MKKTRVIIAVVAAALMIMGVGYAATIWSQDIPTLVDADYGNINVQVAGYTGEGASIDGTTMKIAPNTKLVPGSSLSYTFTLKNNGDAPARYKTAVISNADNTDALRLEVGFGADGIGNFNGYVSNGNPIISPNQNLVLPVGVPVTVTLRIYVPVGMTAPSAADFTFKILSNFVAVPAS